MLALVSLALVLPGGCQAQEWTGQWDFPEEPTIHLKANTPPRVELDPERIPSRANRRLLDHTEMHNIQILQDIKLAEMAERQAGFNYYEDVEVASGPAPDCLQRQAAGGPNCQAENITIRLALNKLFHATNGYWWKNNTNWRSASHYCAWANVGCDDNDVIRTIHMDDFMITDWYNGSLPPELPHIHTLYEMSMACSFLYGSLPSGLERMSQLQLLDLHGNAITGAMPTGLSQLKTLLYLDLTYNQLDGYNFVIGQPTEWQSWGQLTTILGHGRMTSPNTVLWEPQSFHMRGRDGTWDSVGGADKNGTVPGIGGVPPMDAYDNSYADKIPGSPNGNAP